jgi:hypothetical protein
MVVMRLLCVWCVLLYRPWGVRYDIDPETFLILTHEESWNIEPLEVSFFIAFEVLSFLLLETTLKFHPLVANTYVGCQANLS